MAGRSSSIRPTSQILLSVQCNGGCEHIRGHGKHLNISTSFLGLPKYAQNSRVANTLDENPNF